MATATQSTSAAPSPPARLAGESQWIVSPGFDLLFFANLAWLLAWLPWYSSGPGTTHLDYWQLFFITTPHRWITLLLVAADPDRRVDRQRWFGALAVVVFLAVFGVYLYFGTFKCLVIADAVWNGWHFASQHSGITRIYGRKAGGGRRWLDIHALRLFVFLVTLRLLGWSTGWLEADSAGAQALVWFDRVWLAFGAVILAVELIDRPTARPGKVLYVASVVGLYGSLLWAIGHHHVDLVTRLTVAAALFHAVEYLAIVTSYAWRRQQQGSAGLFRQMANRWLIVLALYVLILGLISQYAETSWRELWAGLNLWAAFLHYAFDGMIWKLRKPATAAALGANSTAGGG
jgi:hypothetical protein